MTAEAINGGFAKVYSLLNTKISPAKWAQTRVINGVVTPRSRVC